MGYQPAAELAMLQAMPNFGRVGSRRRQLAAGLHTYYRIDYSPDLHGSDRYLYGVMGTSFAGREEAERTRLRVNDAVGRGVPLPEAIERFRTPDHRKTLVEKLAREWLAAVEVEISPQTGRPRSPYTIESYRSVVVNHLGYWQGKTIRDIGPPTLREWVAALRAEGLAPHSIKNAMVPLRGVVDRYREAHPDWPGTPWPTIHVPRKRKRGMPLRDILAALEAMPPNRVGVYLCAFYTMCRPGEARALLMEDYDPATRRLTIARALQSRSGVNRIEGPPKNDEGGTYSLPPDLRLWIDLNRALAAPSEPLFPNPVSGSAWSHTRLALWWRRACERAGVPYVSVYVALKHSPGTALLEAGTVTREELQAVFRHKHVSTQLAYDVANDKRRDRGVAALSELVKGEE